MVFNSVPFLIFFPVTIAVYFLIPSKVRYIWLLLANYVFYMSAEPLSAVFLALTTVVTYFAGCALCKPNISHSSGKRITILSVSVALFFLIFFKYTNFFLSLCSSDKRLNLIVPLGISYYTFQSLTYVIDCYRGKCKCERNILKYALFVSFFPCILAGPIERAGNMLPQIDLICREGCFDTERAKKGLVLMLWGFFQKLVIASRLAILTDYVFGDYENFSGSMILVAVILYAFYIYSDFNGYSCIAKGAATILGFSIMDNFRQPYLAVSVADFWRRWHISLSSWFKDYLYIPLGGNRKGNVRKYINVLIVFLLSGFWHGASLTFILWGALNGIYQVLGALMSGFKDFLMRVLGIRKHDKLMYFLRIAVTFALVDLSWIFFRASSVGEAFAIFNRIFTAFNAIELMNGCVSTLGLGWFNLMVALFGIAVLIFADIMSERRGVTADVLICSTPTTVRWIIYEFMFIMILFSTTLSTQEFLYQAF